MINILKKIAKKLENENVNWILIGSMSLALQGISIKPNDIDILTDSDGLYKFSKIFKKYEVKPIRFKKTNLFRCYFGVYEIDGKRVEIMSDSKINFNGKWVSFLKKMKHIKTVDVDGVKIYTISLEDQLKFYKNLKRKKDEAKIKKIEEMLSGK